MLTTFCPVLRRHGRYSRNTSIRTTGDATQDTGERLADIGGKGLFAKEIHEALADGRIDFAVHSLKDLETELPDGIVLACTLKREDARDALILGPGCGAPTRRDPYRRAAARRGGRHQFGPAPGAASARAPRPAHRDPARQCQHAAGQSEARRGAAHRCWRSPACGGSASKTKRRSCSSRNDGASAGQGIVGVTVRAGDTELRELLAAIEDAEARAVSTAERALLAALDGSCRTPIGGYARLLADGSLHLTGLVARADGSFLLRRTLDGAAADAARLGMELGAGLRMDSPADIFG